jgi:hypothetical protein
VNEQLARTTPAAAELPGIARGAADTLAQVAVSAEPAGWSAVSRSADAMARAGAPPRGQSETPRSTTGDQLMRIAGAMAMAGGARTAPEVVALLAVIVQATRLAQRIADLRQAQEAANAAARAREAAERMLPLLRQAADAGLTLRPDETAALAAHERTGQTAAARSAQERAAGQARGQTAVQRRTPGSGRQPDRGTER